MVVCFNVDFPSAPARLVICDMVQGSVEKIIRSFWLFGLLERLRVLQMIVKRRQISYNVMMQVRETQVNHR